MVKRKAIKREKKTARKKSARPESADWKPGEPERGEMAAKEVAELFARLEAEPGDVLALEELKRIVFGIIGGAMRWAHEGESGGRSAWAGRVLAELATVFEKRNDWLAGVSPSYKKRRAELSPLRDLRAKPSGLSPCMRHVLAAHGRVMEILRADFWRDVWQEIGAQCKYPAKDLLQESPAACPGSMLENGIPAIVADIEGTAEDAEAAWFEKVIWPLLCERREEIVKDAEIKRLLNREKKRRLLKKEDSFSTIQSDFRKAWRTLYRKPGGRLVGIERERAL